MTWARGGQLARLAILCARGVLLRALWLLRFSLQFNRGIGARYSDGGQETPVHDDCTA
jgi:hypothetical protein